jgi:hypothetical protein
MPRQKPSCCGLPEGLVARVQTMDRRAGKALWLAPVLALLLLACDGAKREQQQAALQRQRQLDALLNRCRSQQDAVRQQVDSLDSSNARLARLALQTYGPLARPAAPDPELLARYTRDDQELELERHAQAMERWRQEDGAQRRRWQLQQQARRQELTAGRAEALAALDKLGVAATVEARTAWSRCDLALLEQL